MEFNEFNEISIYSVPDMTDRQIEACQLIEDFKASGLEAAVKVYGSKDKMNCYKDYKAIQVALKYLKINYVDVKWRDNKVFIYLKGDDNGYLC